MISTDIHSPVSAVMSTDLITVLPFDPVHKIIKVFRDHDFHHIPVVENGLILGMISKLDLLGFFEDVSRWVDGKHQTQYMMENATASELMTKDIVTLKPTDTLQHAVSIFRENYFRSLPVVDENGKLEGIVTTYDILCHTFKPEFLKQT